MGQIRKRRVFYSHNRADYYQTFSFVQEKDASIYCKWPGFNETKWIGFEVTEKGPAIAVADTPITSEKLSIHGSGIAKFRQEKRQFDPQRIKGHFLLDLSKKRIAPRHLFTGFMAEPKCLPKSPFGNRKTDTPIYASEHTPFAIVFFAVPQQQTPLRIGLEVACDIGFMGKDVPMKSGSGLFSLSHHDIFWFIYKTAFMDNWPKRNHIFYYDGFLVPLFIGQKFDGNSERAAIVAVLQEPQYTLIGNDFRLKITFPEPRDIGMA